MQRYVTRPRLVAAAIVVWVILYESWIIQLSPAIRRAGFLLLIGIPILLIGTHYRFPSRLKPFLIGAYLVALLGIPITVTRGGSSIGTLADLVGYFWPVAFAAAAAMRLGDTEARDKTMRYMFWIGLATALQAIVLFLLVVSGHRPSVTVLALAGKTNVMRIYGLWGFAQGTSAWGTHLEVYRAQSWWGEPSPYALWLQAAFAFGFALRRKAAHRLPYTAGLAAIAVALFLTFSHAAFLALAAAAVFWVALVPLRHADTATRAIVVAALTLVGILLLPPTIDLLTRIYARPGRIAVALGKSPLNADGRLRVAGQTAEHVLDRPLGNGWAPIDPTNRAGLREVPAAAPAMWLLRYGLAAIWLVLGFGAWLMFSLVLPGMTLRDTRPLAMGAMIQATHQMSAGTWLQAGFLLTLVVLAWEMEGRRFERPPRSRPRAGATAPPLTLAPVARR